MKSVQSQPTNSAVRVPELGEIGLANYAPYLMNRIMGRYNAKIRKQMQALGLTTPQLRALAVLSVNDSINISDLVTYAVVEQSTMSRALDKLAADGLIDRATDPRDSRATIVRITEAGRKAFRVVWPAMAQSYLALFDGIESGERTAFVATLQKILSNVKEREI